MLRTSKKLMVSFIAALLMLSIVLTGCSSNNHSSQGSSNQNTGKTETNDNTETATKEYDPIEIRIAYRHFVPDAVVAIMQRKAKERWNVDLVVDQIDKNVYIEKLNVSFAAGTVADIFWTDQLDFITQAIQNNALLPLDDLRNEEPWKQLPDSNFSVMDGAVYTFPSKIAYPNTIHIRTDWADHLGLKTPTNPEELYEMLRAFAKDDPNRDGQANTYGFSIQSDFGFTEAYWHMFLPAIPKDLGLYYDQEAGEVKSVLQLTDDMKLALEWFHRAHKEKVLDPEWLLDNGNILNDKFIAGQLATWTREPQFLLPRYNQVKTNFPEAETFALPVIQGKYGPNLKASEKTGGNYFVNAKTKDPERTKLVYSYFNGPEFAMDHQLGEEGVTYTIVDGQLNWLDKEMEQAYNPGDRIISSPFDIEFPVKEPILEKNLQIIEGFVRTKDLSPLLSVSTLYAKNKADINKAVIEGMTKIIIGEWTVDQYDEVINSVNDTLNKVLEDINQS